MAGSQGVKLPEQALPSTLSALLHEHSLAEALALVEQNLRRKPALSGHLLRLDLLCLLRQWDRAAQQTETCIRFDASCLPLMALIHALVVCEKQREAVFAGQGIPGALPVVPEKTPSWLVLQQEALKVQAEAVSTADDLRGKALSMVPDSSGVAVLSHGNNIEFQWITDSDTRLGPVLEIFTQDNYLWLPFADLEYLELAEPASLRDFVWMPAVFETHGQRRHGFLPGIYPASASIEDSFALGRETSWQDVGSTGVFGQGQKVFCTDNHDLPLFELRRIQRASNTMGSTA